MDTFSDFKEPRPFNADEQQAIDHLKQMFKQTTDINFQTDNHFLTRFLRYRDWDAQAAYESIKNYYKIKVRTMISVKIHKIRRQIITLEIIVSIFISSVIIHKCTYKKTYPNTWTC